MKTLNEILSERVSAPKSNLDNSIAELAEIGKFLESVAGQIKLVDDEIKSHQQEENGVRVVIDSNKVKIAELEQEIEKLVLLNDGMRDAIKKIEDKTSQSRDKIRQIEKSASDQTHRRKKIVDEKPVILAEVKQARINALADYVVIMQGHLASEMMLRDEKIRQAQTKTQFEQAKNQDAYIKALFEEVQELEKLLLQSSVASIKVLLEAQLQGKKQKIEDKYPGALASGSYVNGTSEEKQLFYVEVKPDAFGRRVYWIFLPITPDLLAEIRDGEDDHAVRGALKMVFAFSKAFILNNESARVIFHNNFTVLEAHGIDIERPDLSEVFTGYFGTGLSLTKLPYEIEEVVL